MNEQEISINFSNKIYSIDSIKKTSDAFKDICNTSITDNNFNLILTKIESNENDNHDLEKIKDEFCNYVIAMMNDE